MSSNQIGGFFNRLEASRKYLFGSVGVLGTANNSVIAGALIARAPDWESYTYERIDLENAEQKAFFEAALAWDLEVGDKKWVDGKNVRRSSVHFSSQVVDFPSTVQVNVLASVHPGFFDVTRIWSFQMALSASGRPASFCFHFLFL